MTKQDGMARVDAHADAAWKVAAAAALVMAAWTKPELTTDDVWALMSNNVYTHDHRAMGPVMMRGARAGLIEKSKKPAVETARPAAHRRPLQVWVSLIYQLGVKK